MYSIKKLDIGLTTRCNASCPQCARTNKTTLKAEEWLEHSEIDLDKFTKIVPPEQLRDIELISLCGTYGDPLVCKEIFEILNYIIANNPNIKLYIHTNGSMHDTKWWYTLGRILKHTRTKITFGIDGIDQQSHSTYRINTSFDKILKHAGIVKMYGIQTEWQFLVFDYNKHLIEEAREMAKKHHFDNFFTLVTNRTQVMQFYTPDGMKSNGREKDNKFDASVKGISCISKNNNEVHINAYGYILPCCYFDHYFMALRYRLDSKEISDIPKDKLKHVEEDLEFIFKDMDIFDGVRHSLAGVVSNGWFDELLERHKTLKPNKCFKICGVT